MSHGIQTLLLSALRSAYNLPLQQQQAVHAACEAGQRHLDEYTLAQESAEEETRAGNSANAHEASRRSLIALRAAQIQLRTAWDRLGILANRTPWLGTLEPISEDTSDLQRALRAHFLCSNLGPGNHPSYQAFYRSWDALAIEVSSQPAAALRFFKVTDVQVCQLPPIPPYEMQLIQQGSVIAKPTFVVPDIRMAHDYGHALQQVNETQDPLIDDPLIEIILMPCEEFLDKCGSEHLTAFVHCMHFKGYPSIIGTFLEQVGTPGLGRLVATPFES